MGKQETFQITLDEEQVASLRKRVADGEFPTIDAAIAAALEAYELDMPPIGDADFDALAEAGAASGNFKKWEPDVFLAELRERPVKGK